jgi:hypothetical protein
VPVEDCQDIERFVKSYVRVKLGGCLEMIGDLIKVNTWTQKEKGEIVGIYKEIHFLVESVSCTEGELRFPDKKCPFMDEFEIQYITDRDERDPASE